MKTLGESEATEASTNDDDRINTERAHPWSLMGLLQADNGSLALNLGRNDDWSKN